MEFVTDKKSIFLAPRSNEAAYSAFKSTIKYGVDYNNIKDFLTDEGKAILSGQKKIYAWGCAESLKSRWNKMEREDYVLFYVKGVFRYVGQLIYKQFDEKLSEALWPPRKSNHWSCVFFLTNIRDIYIPLKEINKLAGYNLKELYGFQTLNVKGKEAIYSIYGDPENFLNTQFPRLKASEELDLVPADFDSILLRVGDLKEPEVHDLHPERHINVRDLIAKAEDEWVLPKFQRYYDWKKTDVQDLLESIFYDYYIGSLLIWRIKGLPELQTTNIECVEKDNNKSAIILDGQQRITSLYYAIKAPDCPLKDTQDQVFFYIDLNSYITETPQDSMIKVLNNKYSYEETFELMLFPFYEMGNITKWVNFCEDYLLKIKRFDADKVRDLRRFMDSKLRHFWENYKIPVIQLPETLDLEHIAVIFERINSRGKPLTSFDLLIARLWKFDIDLKDLWDCTLNKYPNIDRYHKQYSEKIPLTIFQTMSLSYNKTSSVKRKEILNIYDNVFKDQYNLSFDIVWNEISIYIDRAISRLEGLRNSGGFGVKDQRVLPFLPTIPLLAALLKENEKIVNKIESNKKIEAWYWSVVFSNAYSSAVESKLTQDFKEMQKWLLQQDSIPRTVQDAGKRLGILNLREIESISNAIYRGILSLIGLEGAIDLP